MTLVYLKLLKHATHHLEQSLSRDSCTSARANTVDGGALIRAGSESVSFQECGRNESQLHPNLWWGGNSGPFLWVL